MKMKTIRHIFTIGFLLSCIGLSAQQEPLYTHYMYNTLAYNPAYAGSRDAMSFFGLARFQWVGVQGAPMTQNFQIHSPFVAGLCGGIGVVNDKIGPTNNTTLALDLTYRFNLGRHHRLAIGMKGGLDFFNNNLASVNTNTDGDPAFNSNVSRTLPNIGAGIYYDHTNFYIGFSVPKIVEHRLNTQGLGEMKRHYYVMAGGFIPIGRDFGLKPTGMLRMTENAPLQAEVTLEALIVQRFSIGAFYRSMDGVGGLLGFNVVPNFRIGYSFDWPLTELSGVGHYGSHEIMLRYDLKFGNMAKIKSPRYF
jgi:type IX secretion system PorP/SprF family membrane protein